MALSDPQVVTINAVATNLIRVSQAPGGFRKDDGTVVMTVSHQNGKRIRSTVRLDLKKIAADPLVPTQNTNFGMSAYLVVDRPNWGFTNTEVKYIVDALTKWLTDTSGANTTKLIQQES